MTKSEIRDSKKRIIRRVNEILDDYLMDEDETGAILDFQFFRGEEEQAKHLTWSKPNGKPHYKAVRLSDLLNEGVLAESKQKTGWISVNDRLPECESVIKCNGFKFKVSADVLLWNESEGYMLVGSYDYSNNSWLAEYDNPTHWMPLPEPPEQKGESEA